MFSYLFIALFIYLLFDLEKHPDRKRIFWLIPLQFLWVNFHLFFFVGIMLVAGFLFEKIILNFKTFWRDPMIKKLFLILPMLVIVVFINPNGVEGAFAPFKTHTYATFQVSENQPLFNLKASILAWDIFNSPFAIMVIFLLLSFIFAFAAGGNKPIFFLLAGIGSAGVGLVQIRLITLFALIFLPAVSANFNGAYFKIKNWLERKWPKPAAVFGVCLAIVIFAVYPYKIYKANADAALEGYKTGWGIGLDSHSNDAGKFFKENGIKGPIFNNYDIGGYIIYHLFPKEKVFIDNNGADSYPAYFFENILIPTLTQEEKWQEMRERYKLNAIFIGQRDGSPMVGNFLWRRLRDPLWTLVYADTYAIIFVRNIPENQEIIKKFRITPENIKEKISHMIESDDITDKVIAGRFLYLIGREDLSTSVFKKVVAKYPKNSWVWLYMGSTKVMKDDAPNLISAIIFLENAVNMGEKTSESYTWLGLAYFKSGQFKKAENLFQKALWLEPGRQDTEDYLRQLRAYLNQEN